MNYYLAIDIGASSGRHILGHVEEGRLVLEEVFRFENGQIRRNGHDCWDMERIWDGILGGLMACGERGKRPLTVGIDTWGVDYVLLDGDDRLVGDAVAYRDRRTEGMDRYVEERISPAALYERTGTQKAAYNTIYQLAALQREHPEQLERARSLLMIPDYWHFRLTGVKSNEYTIATTTNLVHAASRDWDWEVIGALGLPAELFHPLSQPGTVLGSLRPELAERLGFDTTVLLPAAHDTASAFLAVPAADDRAVCLSSGTWSLLGVERERPITTRESREQGFTNEGGAWGRCRCLKNIMGLWMIQSIRRELNGVSYVQGKDRRQRAAKQWSFPELAAEAQKVESFPSVVDVNHPAFLSPDSMLEAVRGFCADTGQPVPQTVGEIMQCVYTSLARCYAQSIAGLERITGERYTSINIVGGGCQDDYLNRRTALETGLPVYTGPVEGTAIGNLLVQMIAGGEFPDLATARAAIRGSFRVGRVDCPRREP